MLKNVFILFIAMALFGCTGMVGGGGGVEQAISDRSVAAAAYLICKDNPDAIPKIMVVCKAPDEELASALAGLTTSYGGAIDDPFLKLQADIVLKAFLDQYGVDLLNPDFDFTTLQPEEIRPFVDLFCSGADAAVVARE